MGRFGIFLSNSGSLLVIGGSLLFGVDVRFRVVVGLF